MSTTVIPRRRVRHSLKSLVFKFSALISAVAALAIIAVPSATAQT